MDWLLTSCCLTFWAAPAMGGETAFTSKSYLAVWAGARVVGLFGLDLWRRTCWTRVDVPCEAADGVALASAVLTDGLESIEEVESLSGLW